MFASSLLAFVASACAFLAASAASSAAFWASSIIPFTSSMAGDHAVATFPFSSFRFLKHIYPTILYPKYKTCDDPFSDRSFVTSFNTTCFFLLASKLNAGELESLPVASLFIIVADNVLDIFESISKLSM